MEFVLFFVLLCMSAFASASEVALFSLTPNQIRSLEKMDSRRSRAVLRRREDEEYTLATILILNNLVNICIVILSSIIIDELFTFTSVAWQFVVKTIIVTFVLLLCGEITPKIFAQHHSLGMSLFAAVLLSGLRHFFKPLSWLLVCIGRGINRRNRREGISMDELSSALNLASPQNQQEREMLSEIVEFAQTEVREIMHHRPDVTAISVESGFDEVRRVITSSGFSRIPIYEESIDNIKGVLYIKDLIAYIGKGDDFEWRRYVRPAYFVPERKKINDLLEEFRTNKVHVAIVVDEYGSTLGLVSLEDVLEEIVGEIVDESDVEHTFYTTLGEGRYLFDGKTAIPDFVEVMKLSEQTFEKIHNEAETLAGLLLEVKGDFLSLNESVDFAGLRFTVRSLDKRRIDKIEVAK